MGWTFYHVPGKIDIKAEVEKLISGKVLKSVVVGRTWYGACQMDDGSVTAGVVLIKTNNRYYENFGYKCIHETMGPGEAECPESILNLLTPIDDEWANEWRKKCHKYNQNVAQLKKLPLGSVISSCGMEFTKTMYRGRQKWINYNNRRYLAASHAARCGYEIVK